jgi:O-antigen ligase
MLVEDDLGNSEVEKTRTVNSGVIGWATLIFVLLIICGYLLITVTTIRLGIPNTPVSIGYRLTMMCSGLLLMIVTVMRRFPFRLSVANWFLLCFWFVYGLVLINDISIENIRFRGKSEFYLYSFAFGSSFLAFITAAVAGSQVRFNKLSVHLLLLFFLMVNVAVCFQFLSEGGLTLDTFSNRAVLSDDDGNLVNPITIGQFGAYALSTAMAAYVVSRLRSTSAYFLMAACAGIGVINILLSASRGPFLFFFVGVVLIMIYYFYNKRLSFISYFSSMMKVAIVGGILLTIAITKLSNVDFYLFRRISSFVSGQKGKKEIRDYEWESAINQFLSHPVVGDKYITDYDRFYPHNIYLEVLMSTGVIGGTLFFTGLILVLWKFVEIIRFKHRYMLPFFVILCLVMSFRVTSSALYMTAEFWVMMGLIGAQTNFSKWNTATELQ